MDSLQIEASVKNKDVHQASTHRFDVLEETVNSKFPRVAAIHWNYNICKHSFWESKKLIKCFKQFEENCD